MFLAAPVETVLERAVVLEAKPTTASYSEIMFEFSMECLEFRGQMASYPAAIRISEVFPAVIEVPTESLSIEISKL